MDKITRREKLLAKVCWPEIDTQRTRFLLVTTGAASVALLVSASQLKHITDSASVDPVLTLDRENIWLNKWVYRGKRHNVVARWGYSSLLDTVVIRDVRVEHHTAQAVVPVLRRMFSDTP
jgi:hypothetical protein